MMRMRITTKGGLLNSITQLKNGSRSNRFMSKPFSNSIAQLWHSGGSSGTRNNNGNQDNLQFEREGGAREIQIDEKRAAGKTRAHLKTKVYLTAGPNPKQGPTTKIDIH
jgi:hypothetical protein